MEFTPALEFTFSSQRNNRITYSTYFLASPCTLSLSSEKAIRSIWYATICLSKFLDCTYSSNCCTCQSILPPHNTSHPCIFSHFITPFYYMEHIARCIALLLYSSKWITLSSVNCFNTGNAIEKMNESATSTKRPRILLPPFYIDCYRLLLFRHFYKIFSTIFYLHNTLAHIVYQTFFVQMTIRVSIPHKA